MATDGGAIQDDAADNENRSDTVPAFGGEGGTPATDNTTSQSLNRPDIEGDDSGSQSRPKSNKRRIPGEIGEINLRQFSPKVCEKVESKGITTYSEVADELISEYPNPSPNINPEQQQYDYKNIRRRVYDILNVLDGMDIISKERKHIQWKGLPGVKKGVLEQIRSRIQSKRASLKTLNDAFMGVQNLIYRNDLLYGSEIQDKSLTLPFELLRIRSSYIDVAILEDEHVLQIDMDSFDFKKHDHFDVLMFIKKYEDELYWDIPWQLD